MASPGPRSYISGQRFLVKWSGSRCERGCHLSMSRLPGGGTVATLWSSRIDDARARLLVLEQRAGNQQFRWLCSVHPGQALTAESVLEVAQREQRRITRQSTSMTEFDRSVLLPEYHRAMVAALGLSSRQLHHVCFIGVGAGTLPLFLSQHHPRCIMTGAEADLRMLPLARQYFGCIPGPRLRLHELDGNTFLRRHPRARFDTIFLDATGCGKDGAILAPPEELCTPDVLRTARLRLRPGGLLVINSYGGQAHRRRTAGALLEAFGGSGDGPVERLSTREGNDVLVAIRGDHSRLDRHARLGRGDDCRLGHADRLVWSSACLDLGLSVKTLKRKS